MQSSEEEKEIKSKFCERCYYLITNFTNEESFLDRIKLLELTSNPHCNFCFGIFNLDNYKEIISTVKAQIRKLLLQIFLMIELSLVSQTNTLISV